MLILSLHFWRRADSTCFVSCSAFAPSFFTLQKSDMTEFSNVSCYCINIFAITITPFSKLAGVWEVFSHSFLWRHFQIWFCYCSSMCSQRNCSVIKMFILLSSFSLFSFFRYSAFKTFQLFQTFSFMFSLRNC